MYVQMKKFTGFSKLHGPNPTRYWQKPFSVMNGAIFRYFYYVRAWKEWKERIEEKEEIGKNAGYRQGITDGKDSVFQDSFDKAFEVGMSCAFRLGFYSGVLGLQKTDDNVRNKVEEGILIKSHRANCEICRDNHLLEQDLTNVINQQLEVNKNALGKIQQTYADVLQDLNIDINQALTP